MYCHSTNPEIHNQLYELYIKFEMGLVNLQALL